jgi:RNA polymerase sigma-70 factor (ECF subfamily)
MNDVPGEITQLLRQMSAGRGEVADKLVPLVYRELHRVAARQMAREKPGHTLQPTALVHEAYLRLVNKRDLAWQDRMHFFAVAAREMRRVLVDLARLRHAKKRGGMDARHVDLDEVNIYSEENLGDLLVLNDALDRLAAIDPRQREIVELRFFAGLTVEEVAASLKISTRTVTREWNFAKAWLHAELAGDADDGSGA